MAPHLSFGMCGRYTIRSLQPVVDLFGLPFPPEARRRIMGLNASEFFGLDAA